MPAIHNEQDPVTGRIIECAIDVHAQLGPGLLESAYQGAMCVALADARMSVTREKSFPIMYRGARVGDYRPDLIVDETVVVEIKSVARYDPVFLAQMLTYLRVTQLRVGLILNFNRPRLADGIKRVAL